MYYSIARVVRIKIALVLFAHALAADAERCSSSDDVCLLQLKSQTGSHLEEHLTSDGGSKTTTGDLTPFTEKILEEHNKRRCIHGLEYCVWDEKIAAKAQEYVNTNPGLSHSSTAFRTFLNDGGFNGYHGENIFQSFSPGGNPEFLGNMAAKLWYDEIKNTAGGKGAVPDGSGWRADPPNGHYIQMMTKGDTRLGCGLAHSTVVCMYGRNPGENRPQYPIPGAVRDPASCEDLGSVPTPAPTPWGVRDGLHVLQTTEGSDKCLSGIKNSVMSEVAIGPGCVQFRFSATTRQLQTENDERTCVDYFAHQGKFGLYRCHGGDNQKFVHSAQAGTFTLSGKKLYELKLEPTPSPTPAPKQKKKRDRKNKKDRKRKEKKNKKDRKRKKNKRNRQ